MKENIHMTFEPNAKSGQSNKKRRLILSLHDGDTKHHSLRMIYATHKKKLMAICNKKMWPTWYTKATKK